MDYGENRELKVSPHHPASGHLDDPINSQYSHSVSDHDLRAPAKSESAEIGLADIVASIATDRVEEKFEQRAEVLANERKSIARILAIPGLPEHDSAELERAARSLSHLAGQLATDTESLAVRFGVAARSLERMIRTTSDEVARQTAEVRAELNGLKTERAALRQSVSEQAEVMRLRSAELEGLRKSFINETKMHEARLAALRVAEGDNQQ